MVGLDIGLLARGGLSRGLLTSLCLAWNVAADIDKTPAHVVVVECPVERIGEFVEAWL